MSTLPTFEEMRRNAHRMLGDVEDELRSDWAPGHGPATREAGRARKEALEHVARAKAALDAAAQAESTVR